MFTLHVYNIQCDQGALAFVQSYIANRTHQRYGKRGVDSQCVRLEKSKITMNVFLDVVFVVVVMMNHITHRYQRR